MSEQIVFFTAPGATTDDPIQDKLLRSHEREAAKKRAEFLNYGWGSDDYGIASKTTRGILESHIDPATMRVSHTWTLR